MSNTKNANNQPSKYQELNDSELEIVCGGSASCSSNVDGKDFMPETISYTKTEAA